MTLAAPDSPAADRAGVPVPLLSVRGIVKDFPGQRALDAVSLDLHRGEIHALLGENGAGKSTLIKIVTGVYQCDAGEIRVDGRPVAFGDPHEAQAAGIAVVHQHGNLVPALSVQENLLLGAALPRRLGVLIDWPAVRRRTGQLLERVGLRDIDPASLVSSLRPDEVAMVSIAKAIAADARVIILDEPTTALLPHEVDVLFGHMRRLAAEGHGFIYVSHRLAEVFAIADRASVLRDGRLVWSCADRAGLNQTEVVAAIVGAEAAPDARADHPSFALGETVLELRALVATGVDAVSLELRGGEILGLAGLPGSGAEETIDAIYGRLVVRGGELRVDGQPVRFGSPRDAVAAGLALVPKNRLAEAAISGFSVRENVSLPSLSRLLTDPVLRFVRKGAERRLVTDATTRLRVKSVGIEARIESLSGGNQQKAVIARWLGRGARIYLLNSPTAAVDVGAKAEIYHLLREIAADGAAVIFTSTEVEEFPRLCDRVLVFRDGRVVGEFIGDNATEHAILNLAAGIDAAAA